MGQKIHGVVRVSMSGRAVSQVYVSALGAEKEVPF